MRRTKYIMNIVKIYEKDEPIWVVGNQIAKILWLRHDYKEISSPLS